MVRKLKIKRLYFYILVKLRIVDIKYILELNIEQYIRSEDKEIKTIGKWYVEEISQLHEYTLIFLDKNGQHQIEYIMLINTQMKQVKIKPSIIYEIEITSIFNPELDPLLKLLKQRIIEIIAK